MEIPGMFLSQTSVPNDSVEVGFLPLSSGWHPQRAVWEGGGQAGRKGGRQLTLGCGSLHKESRGGSTPTALPSGL